MTSSTILPILTSYVLTVPSTLPTTTCPNPPPPSAEDRGGTSILVTLSLPSCNVCIGARFCDLTSQIITFESNDPLRITLDPEFLTPGWTDPEKRTVLIRP